MYLFPGHTFEIVMRQADILSLFLLQDLQRKIPNSHNLIGKIEFFPIYYMAIGTMSENQYFYFVYLNYRTY